MKLILESPHEITTEVVENLNEATGKTEKSYYISGIFSTIGEKNRNGRIYPESIWKPQVEEYQKEIQNNTKNICMEYEHPDRAEVDPMKAVAVIKELKIDGKYVKGKAKLLNNDEANQLKSLIDEGVKIGVSSRGVGSVGSNGIVDKFKLITYDVVSSPSDYNGLTSGLKESFDNGILKDKEFEINEDGDVITICCEDVCIKEHKKDVVEAIKHKLTQIYINTKNK